MSPAAFNALAVALRGLADIFEAEASVDSAPETTGPSARYYTRKNWIESGGEARVFDRAIGSIRSFRAGRKRTVLCDEMHAWIESHAVPATPKKNLHSGVLDTDSDVDRELRKLGESPRTPQEIAFDQWCERKGLPVCSAKSIVKVRREEEAKRRRDADPEIARATAEATREADARATKQHKYPLLECTRCLRNVPQWERRKQKRGVRARYASGEPARHKCPHDFGEHCSNAQGNLDYDGTIICPWCVADRSQTPSSS
jgi:hypothetical protein